MKKSKRSDMPDQEKCFLFIEAVQIYIYLVFCILMLAFSIKMYAFWSVNSVNYYLDKLIVKVNSCIKFKIKNNLTID